MSKNLITLANIDAKAKSKLLADASNYLEDLVDITDETINSASFWVARYRKQQRKTIIEKTKRSSNRWISILCWPLRREGERGDLVSSEDALALTSFKIAGEQLGAQTCGAFPDLDESLSDVIRCVIALASPHSKKRNEQSGCLVIRHKDPTVAHKIAQLSSVCSENIGVLNGGSVAGENLVETLLYLSILNRECGPIQNLSVTFVGNPDTNILERSLLSGLADICSGIHLVSPSLPTFRLPANVKYHRTFPKSTKLTDAVLTFSIQHKESVFIQNRGRSAFNGKTVLIPCGQTEFPSIFTEHSNKFRIVRPNAADGVAIRIAAIRYCLS